MLYYAIGDIHGCRQPLDDLLGVIRDHAGLIHGGREYKLVFLGDYVDRGPDSKGVMDRVISLHAQGHIALPGNHEWLMFQAITHLPDDYAAAKRWRKSGGRETLESYGVPHKVSWRVRGARNFIPLEHVQFLHKILNDQPVYHLDREDGLFFVHAGVRPSVPLEEHTDEVFLWARSLAGASEDEPMWVENVRVVHGHTPEDRPVVSPSRVGLDTGAVFGGALSAGVFVDGELTDILSVPGWEKPDNDPFSNR